MKKIINEMKLRLPAKGVNEAVARSCISAFAAELNPTVEEIGDLRPLLFTPIAISLRERAIFTYPFAFMTLVRYPLKFPTTAVALKTSHLQESRCTRAHQARRDAEWASS